MHKSMRQLAEEVRGKGKGYDKILAHIDPMEQKLLHMISGGGSINRTTGLPQYGFLSKVVKSIGKVFKQAAPALTAVGLTALGVPPMASMAASGVVGSSQRGKGNKGRGFFDGAGQGAAYHFGSGLGSGNNPFSSLMGGNSGIGGMLSNMMGGNQDEEQQYMDDANQQMMQYHGSKNNSGHQNYAGNGGYQGYQSPEDNYGGYNIGQLSQFAPSMNKGSAFDFYKLKSDFASNYPEFMKKKKNYPEFTKRTKKNKFPGIYDNDEDEENLRRYAFGGHVKGKGTGIDDKIKKKLPKGSYVVRAIDVALLGDGSTTAGVEKLTEFEDSFVKSGIVKAFDDESKNVTAWVSNDEYVVRREIIDAIGDGDNEKGAKIMREMTENLRKHKGIQNNLPPKSKNINEYMKGGK